MKVSHKNHIFVFDKLATKSLKNNREKVKFWETKILYATSNLLWLWFGITITTTAWMLKQSLATHVACHIHQNAWKVHLVNKWWMMVKFQIIFTFYFDGVPPVFFCFFLSASASFSFSISSTNLSTSSCFKIYKFLCRNILVIQNFEHNIEYNISVYNIESYLLLMACFFPSQQVLNSLPQIEQPTIKITL